MGVFCVITRPSRRSHRFAAVLAVAALIAGAPLVTGAATSPAASGDGAVVAQALVELDGRERQWATTSSDIGPGGAPIGSAGPGFAVAAEGDPLLLEGADGGRAYLATGEAVFQPAGDPAVAVSLGGAGRLVGIALVRPGEDGSVGDPIASSAGAYDLELRVATIAVGEQFDLFAQLPALVYVLDGDVTVREAGLVAGEAVAIAGQLAVENAGDGEALVAIATVTPVDLPQPTETEDVTGSTPATAAATTTSVAPSAPTTPPPPSAPTTTTTMPTTTTTSSPPTTAPPSTTVAPTTPPDSDGDGLSDSDEAAYGTNPGAFDTDGDGLGDGDEVLVYGLDPTDSDTDDDGFADPE